MDFKTAYRTVLNFGVSDPLTLSMGHPMVDRVSLLGKPSHIMAWPLLGTLFAAGLITTAQAASSNKILNNLSPFEISLTAISQEMNGDGEPLSPERLLVEVINTPDGETDLQIKIDEFAASEAHPNALNLVLVPLLEDCGNHTVNTNLPQHSFRQLDLSAIDYPNSKYLIVCTPGDVTARQALTLEDMIAGIIASPEVTSGQKETYIFGLKLGTYIYKTLADENLPESEKQRLIEDYTIKNRPAP